MRVADKLFYAYSEHEKDGTVKDIVQVIDDKSVEGSSLAMRRLRLKDSGTTLAKLKHAVFFIADMVKLSKNGTWFIDSEGTLFEYKKSKRVPLVFRPISQIIPMKHGGALVEVKGLSTRFKTLHAPTGLEKYAGLLLVGTAHILYGLYKDKLEDTVRMI